MGKDKIKRFRENDTFECMIQPKFEEIFQKDHPLKGNWRRQFFKNTNPISLELGCGRGEYTVALGKMFPEKNFIGIDIKGARMWRGARTATDDKMSNVAFVRTRIEFIKSFFGPGEIDEIWITFPDPQLKKGREKKRLTAPGFLAMYSYFLKPGGHINLKTDSRHLHNYTKAVAEANSLDQLFCCNDIYGTGVADDILSIKTTYETRFLSEGLPITYLKFSLGGKTSFLEPEFEDDKKL